MALKLVFNPFTAKLDWVDITDTSTFAPAVPQIVANGVTFQLVTNTQVPYANAIVVEAGGIVLTNGTAALTYVN